MVHLLPLPGAPRGSPGLDGVLRRCAADAAAIAAGGADALLVENFGDAPFCLDAVPPWTVAAMTRAVLAARDAAPDLLCGVNVLRNDAQAALAVASATGAHFVRVNVHTGVMVTDQGVATGQARATLLTRALLDARVSIAADVLVKHAAPLAPVDIADVARDTLHRGCADVLIVSGRGTGRPTDAQDVERVAIVAGTAPVWVGSGLTATDPTAASNAHGAIVGTALHLDGDLTAPVDAERVRRMRDALDGLPELR